MRRTSDRPCYKLSVDLLATYKRINELFYEAKRRTRTDPKKPSFNDGYDDEHGNYVVQTGEEIHRRYIVQDVLGKGSFGVVVKAHDNRHDQCVAIKIIKNKVQFYHQAKVEIEILNKLNTADEDNNVVKLKKVFTWKDHLCLVFELLSFNLYDLLKYTKFSGVSLSLIKKFAWQILRTLDQLAVHPVAIIHCDLKPENILLKNPKRSAIKVIDFGSSCFINKKVFKYIQSRFYRSPEVILGLSYDCAIDMWSLACILVEMHTGVPLFDGKDEAEQMCKMAAVLGSPTGKLIDASPKKKNFFQWDEKSKRWVLAPPNKELSLYPKNTLELILGATTGGPGGRRRKTPGHTEEDYASFIDLLRKMLVYNPKERLTPAHALRHPFLAAIADTELDKAPRTLSPRGRGVAGGGGSTSSQHRTPSSGVVVSQNGPVSSSHNRDFSREREAQPRTQSTHASTTGREARHGRDTSKRSLSLGGSTLHNYHPPPNANVTNAPQLNSSQSPHTGSSVPRSHSRDKNAGTATHSPATGSRSGGRVSSSSRGGGGMNTGVSGTGGTVTSGGGVAVQYHDQDGVVRNNPAYSRSHSAYGSTHNSQPAPAPDQYPQYYVHNDGSTGGAGGGEGQLPLRLQPKHPGSTGQLEKINSPINSPRQNGSGTNPTTPISGKPPVTMNSLVGPDGSTPPMPNTTTTTTIANIIPPPKVSTPVNTQGTTIPFPTSPSAAELFSPTYAATHTSTTRYNTTDGAAESLLQQPNTPRTGGGAYASSPGGVRGQNLTDEPPQQLVGIPATHQVVQQLFTHAQQQQQQQQQHKQQPTDGTGTASYAGEHGGAEPMIGTPPQ